MVVERFRHRGQGDNANGDRLRHGEGESYCDSVLIARTSDDMEDQAIEVPDAIRDSGTTGQCNSSVSTLRIDRGIATPVVVVGPCNHDNINIT